MMAEDLPGSWCDIHRARIARNLDRALALLPAGRQFCAVLKADAYGHGIGQVVPLIRRAGVGLVGITSNAEARAAREAGFDGRLIRLRAASPAEIGAARPLRIEEQVASVEAARAIGAAPAHLALNAMGMCRDGLELSTAGGRDTCRAILDRLGRHIVGICTHFPSNSPDDLRRSAARFHDEVDWVLDQGPLERDEVLVHAGSSLTLVSGLEVGTDMYRCGAILYGILETDQGFETTMELRARVVSIGPYPEGATVGYDRDMALGTDRRLACLAIGYADGLLRNMRKGATVELRGRCAPVLGKVSMNTVVVDATGIEGVSVGDEAVVFGGGAAAVARAEADFGTIMADLYSDWGRRNHRIYR